MDDQLAQLLSPWGLSEDDDYRQITLARIEDWRARFFAAKAQARELAKGLRAASEGAITSAEFRERYLYASTEPFSPDRLAEWAAKYARAIGEPVPEWAEDVCREVRCRIETARREFEATGNLMYACKAWISAKSIGDPPPDWVMSYLDRSIVKFWGAFQQSRSNKINDPGKALLTAFGANKGKGKKTIWEDFPRDYVADNVGFWIMFAARQLSRQGKSFFESGLVDDVRERLEMKERTLWREWERYKRDFPEKIAELERLPGFKRDGRALRRK
jgi:hypothetical protein